MKRIRNDYCWNLLKDWVEAQKKDFIKIQDSLNNRNDIGLKNLIELALNNCFPLQFICVKTNNEMYIIVDVLMKKFLQFINNEIPVTATDERKIFFQELSVEEQNKILQAEVNSVWISTEQIEQIISL